MIKKWIIRIYPIDFRIIHLYNDINEHDATMVFILRKHWWPE